MTTHVPAPPTAVDDEAREPDRSPVSTAPDPVQRVLAAAPLALLVLLLAVVLRLSALHLGNADTWFHLVLGDRFRSGWSLAHPGAPTPFATTPWVPTQWSTEILASLAQSWFGLPGVAWLFGALYLVLVLATYLSCRRTALPLAAVLPTALVVFAAAPALSARPQIVSLVLLTLTVAAWLRTVEDGRPRWWLVPMTWVWATAHGLWSAGVLVGVVCCVGLLLDRRLSGPRGWRVAAVPVFCLTASMLTPVGPRLLSSQLTVSARTSMIAEWGPTSFRSVPALAAALMVAALVVLWARRGGCSWTRLLLLLLAGAWIVLVTRMVSLGAVVVAPMLAEELQRATRPPTDVGIPERLPMRFAMPPAERLTLAVTALAYLMVLAVAAPRLAAAPDGVPSGLAPRLEQLPRGSVVLVADGIGGWLEWRVPSVHPVVDGLLDAYPVAYLHDFFAATRVQPGWQRFVADSGARVAVVPSGSPLRAALAERLGWRPVQHDGRWDLLEAPGR